MTVHRTYDEQDAVFTGESTETAILAFLTAGFVTDPEKASDELEQLLQTARGTRKWQYSKELDLYAGYEEDLDEYALVRKKFYFPENLIAILFERLVRGEGETLEDTLNNSEELVDAYLGVIESREGTFFAEQKRELAALSRRLHETLDMTREEELEQEELYRLSDAIEEAFYRPIAEILEGILVEIAGNNSEE